MSYIQYSQSKLKEVYGLSSAEVNKNLTPVILDFGGKKVRLSVHKKCATSINKICADYSLKILAGKAKPYDVKAASTGSFCWRKMVGGSALSMHSFGIAIDINAYAPNGYGRGAKSNIPKELVKSFNKYGWYWGGNWQSPYDPMHFEYAPLSFPKATNVAKAKTNKKYKMGQVVKTTAKLNLRAKPSTSAKLIKTYKKDTKLTVIKDYGAWLQVNGGFVSENYVKEQ